jgi:hypothetical protein
MQTPFLAVVDPAVAVGHINGGPFHMRDEGANSGSSSVDEGVIGKTEDHIYPFLLQNVGYGSFALHYTPLHSQISLKSSVV